MDNTEGTSIIELLKELIATDSLPPYEEDAIRAESNRISALYEEITDAVQTKNKALYVSANIFVNHTTIAKSKQYILAYLMNRLRKIEKMRWELDAEIPPEIIANMSHLEGQFLISYDKALSQYMDDIGLDLTIDYQQPPKEPFVVVRVLQDCQLTFKNKDVLDLKANTTHFLKRTDVEPLIRTGQLQHVV